MEELIKLIDLLLFEWVYIIVILFKLTLERIWIDFLNFFLWQIQLI